jgi:hypothetical protein
VGRRRGWSRFEAHRTRWRSSCNFKFTAPGDSDTTEVLVVGVVQEPCSMMRQSFCGTSASGTLENSTLDQLHSLTEGTPFTKPIALPHECEHCLANKAIHVRHLAAHGITATRVGQLTSTCTDRTPRTSSSAPHRCSRGCAPSRKTDARTDT